MNKRDTVDYQVIRESNNILKKAFNSAFAKISRLNLADIKDAQLINDIIKTEFDNVVIPIADGMYSGVKEQFTSAIRQAQKDLRSKNSSFKYTFNTTDKAMLDILDEGNSLFLNNLYTNELQGKIIDSMKAMVTENRTKKEIADEIANMIGVVGKRATNNIAQSVITTNTYTRSIATTNLLEKSGVDKFKYIVVMDSKTSPICKALYGKTFEVQKAIQTRDAYINIDRTNYDNFKSQIDVISPMISYDESTDTFFKSSDSKKQFKQTWSKDQIANIPGIAIPPLHYGCRTEITAVI